MRGQTHFKSVVGGIVDENSLAGLYEEKELVAIHQTGPEPIVDSRLAGEFSVKVDGGFEGIVSRREVMGERGRGELCFVPVMVVESVRQTFAVKPHLPGKDTVLLERAAIEFQNRVIVVAREGGKRERAVVVEFDEIRGARVLERDNTFRRRFLKIGDVLNQELAIRLKKRLHLFRQGIDGF